MPGEPNRVITLPPKIGLRRKPRVARSPGRLDGLASWSAAVLWARIIRAVVPRGFAGYWVAWARSGSPTGICCTLALDLTYSVGEDDLRKVCVRANGIRLRLSLRSMALMLLVVGSRPGRRWQHRDSARGGRAQVNWASVQAYIGGCGITGRINDTLLRQVEPGHPMPGVALLEPVEARFDWSDHDVADSFGVYPSVASRYRLTGVPHHRVRKLRKGERASIDEVPVARRTRWDNPERKSKKALPRGPDPSAVVKSVRG